MYVKICLALETIQNILKEYFPGLNTYFCFTSDCIWEQEEKRQLLLEKVILCA